MSDLVILGIVAIVAICVTASAPVRIYFSERALNRKLSEGFDRRRLTLVGNGKDDRFG